MADFVLDTNHLGDSVRRTSSLRDRLQQARRQGDRFAVCWPVLCELEAGICQTARAEAYRRNLHLLLKEVRIWTVDWAIVRSYGALHKRLKRKGRVLSHVDIVLAALTIHWGATLLTADKDFDAVPEMRKENWLPG